MSFDVDSSLRDMPAAARDTEEQGYGTEAHDKKVRSAMWASAVGNILEWFDFGVFAFLSPQIGALFFPSDDPLVSTLNAYVVFGGGFIVRPLGGVLLAQIGDVYGRKVALLVSVWGMAAATAAMGCLPTYADIGPPATILLCLLRLVQGLSVGGELVGSMVFAVESMPENRQVLGGALCMAGCIAGLTLGSLSGLILHAALTPEEILHFGWRIPFGCGMLIGLFAMWMRSYTHEPTIYDMMQNDGDQQHMPEETDTTSKTSTSFPAPSLDVNIARAPTNIAIKHSPPQSPSGPAADAEISVVSAEGAPMESDSGTKQFIQAIDKMAQKLDADTHTTLVVSGGNFGGDTLRRYIAQVKPEEGLPVVRALREHRTEIGLCITVSCVWCAGCWLTVAFPPTMYQILMDPPLSDRILGVVASEAGRRAGADSPVYRPGEDTVWIMHSSCCAFQAAAIVALGILGDKIGGIRLFKLGAVGIALLAIPCFHVMSQGTSLAAVGVAQAGLMLLVGATGAALPSWMVLSYPRAVRFSAIAIGYNVSQAAFGGTAGVVGTLLYGYAGAGFEGFAVAFYLAILAITSAWSITYHSSRVVAREDSDGHILENAKPRDPPANETPRATKYDPSEITEKRLGSEEDAEFSTELRQVRKELSATDDQLKALLALTLRQDPSRNASKVDAIYSLWLKHESNDAREEPREEGKGQKQGGGESKPTPGAQDNVVGYQV